MTTRTAQPHAQPQAVNPKVLEHRHRGWRRMVRVEVDGAGLDPVAEAVRDFMPGKLVYAEGDCWFAGAGGVGDAAASLLDAIRTPFLTAVVDASEVGLTAGHAVHGHRARRTREMFARFGFDAIVLSLGGRDLIDGLVQHAEGEARGSLGTSIDRPDRTERDDGWIAEAVADLVRFVDLRDAAGDAVSRRAPVFIHGYDHLQPRRSAVRAFTRATPFGGPWIEPALHELGYDAAGMRRLAGAAIDRFNQALRCALGERDGVSLIDQRGLLKPAAGDATGTDGDWLDEIHPTLHGFTTLARQRWDVALSRALGWVPKDGDLVSAQEPVHFD